MIKVGSDFSGVGAFDQALKRLEINYDTIFACDMDKYARQTYIENYGEPKYFPKNVYNREIPIESLDIYMTSPPCQSFSLAGKRKGENSDNGVLFYNSHEFIIKNKPRYFIFENVKGLLSDDNGRTFQRWVDFLAKSVNGQPVIFPHEKSANYHVYYKVLNSKDYGVPQNRERIFIVGIRDNEDNNFLFPPKEKLCKKLKDVLVDNPNSIYNLSEKGFNYVSEREGKYSFIDSDIATCLTASGSNNNTGNFITVQEKYYLSDKMLKHLSNHPRSQNFIDVDTDFVNCITANYSKQSSDLQYLNVGKYDKEIKQSISQDVCTTIDASYYKGFGVRQGKCRQVVQSSKRIRRLTPRECFRLQDFPDSFKMPCSDTQMYKQAGNSITVSVLEKIIKRLNIK